MAPAETPRPAAVLTGDLIGSSAAEPNALERAMDILAAAAREIEAGTPGADTRFTRFRGDGWQMHVAAPAAALRAALAVTARLRAVKLGLTTRVAIGIGGIESLGTDSLADARGRAFEASGRALDAMGKTRTMAIDGDGVTTWHRIIVDLLADRARHWTPEQAEATALYLRPNNPTLADIAPTLGITPQAVNYRLTGAGASAIRRALNAWEEDFGRRADAPGGAA